MAIYPILTLVLGSQVERAKSEKTKPFLSVRARISRWNNCLWFVSSLHVFFQSSVGKGVLDREFIVHVALVSDNQYTCSVFFLTKRNFSGRRGGYLLPRRSEEDFPPQYLPIGTLFQDEPFDVAAIADEFRLMDYPVTVFTWKEFREKLLN